MAKGGYSIGDIYQGSYSSLKPSYGNVFTGYRASASNIGMSTDARTANIIKDASKNLSAGAKTIELTQVSPEVFDAIPKQQLKEMNRLSKLTGVDVTVHAPVIEASGLTQQGFTESNRKAVERQMISAVERSHEINPEGKFPVTFHSSAMLPGTILEKGKEKPEEVLVINRETGSINKIPIREEKHFPGDTETNIQNELNKVNEESWLQNISHLSYNSRHAGEIIEQVGVIATEAESDERKGRELNQRQKSAKHAMTYASNFLKDAYREFKGLYESAYDYAATNEDKETIRDLGEQISERVNNINKSKSENEKIILTQEIIDEGVETLRNLSTPKMIEELNEFAKNKTSQTFGDVAFNSYKKFKDKSPIISIENPPAGGAFSTGEELREIVENSRKKFIEMATRPDNQSIPKEQRGLGMSKKEAEKIAEKIIGATWDVGHINMLRKYGYESKDIIEQSKKVAPLTKHVHLSDNFGFEHTELPMGMGNVPVKEIMENLDKEGYKGNKVIEALSWWQHFSEQGAVPPLASTLQAFGSPIYAMEMAPYWNQNVGLQQGYFGGMEGAWLPQVNYETFGTGFSQLPTDLGGQRQGAQGSRMSGRPME